MPAASGNLSGLLLARESWEKPRSESSRYTPRKCVRALQTQAIRGRQTVGKAVPPLQSVIIYCNSRVRGYERPRPSHD
jgi:hypothetical protein